MLQSKKKHVFVFLTTCIAALAWHQLFFSPASVVGSETSDTTEWLRRAEPHERGKIARRIAEEAEIEEARAELVNIIEHHFDYEDTHFVVSCIIALAHLGPEAAEEDSVNALIMAMKESDASQIRYSAARALGYLLKERGSENTDMIRETNTALLSYSEESVGAERYAPSLALFRINEDIDFSEGERMPDRWAQSLEPEELAERVYEKLLENQDRLLDLENQPWPLLVSSYLHAPESDRGREARDLLGDKEPLEAVDFLFNRMQRTSPQEAEWEAMAELLNDLTGVDIDQAQAEAADDISDFMANWRSSWHETLRERIDERHRNYAWNALEQAIQAARFQAYPEDFELLQDLQMVILNQHESANQIPAFASETSRELMEEQLSIKEDFKNTKEDLTEPRDPDARRIESRHLLNLVRDPTGEKIGFLYLDELLEIAREEENSKVLSDLSRVLSTIGGVNIVLEEDIEARANTIDNWRQRIER